MANIQNETSEEAPPELELPGGATPEQVNEPAHPVSEEILTELRKLQTLAEEQAHREGGRSKAVDYLTGELDTLKRQQSGSFLRPLFLDLLRVVDRMEVDLTHVANEQLQGYRDELLEALRRFEVTALDAAEGVFNPEIHQALRTIPAESADTDRHIAQTIRRGYRYQRSILRPSEVIVYKFRPQTQ